jgi:hypothetical protein
LKLSAVEIQHILEPSIIILLVKTCRIMQIELEVNVLEPIVENEIANGEER